MITKNFNFKVGDIVRIIGIFGLDVTGIYMGNGKVFDIIHFQKKWQKIYILC